MLSLLLPLRPGIRPTQLFILTIFLLLAVFGWFAILTLTLCFAVLLPSALDGENMIFIRLNLPFWILGSTCLITFLDAASWAIVGGSFYLCLRNAMQWHILREKELLQGENVTRKKREDNEQMRLCSYGRCSCDCKCCQLRRRIRAYYTDEVLQKEADRREEENRRFEAIALEFAPYIVPFPSPRDDDHKASIQARRALFYAERAEFGWFLFIRIGKDIVLSLLCCFYFFEQRGPYFVASTLIASAMFAYWMLDTNGVGWLLRVDAEAAAPRRSSASIEHLEEEDLKIRNKFPTMFTRQCLAAFVRINLNWFWLVFLLGSIAFECFQRSIDGTACVLINFRDAWEMHYAVRFQRLLVAALPQLQLFGYFQKTFTRWRLARCAADNDSDDKIEMEPPSPLQWPLGLSARMHQPCCRSIHHGLLGRVLVHWLYDRLYEIGLLYD